MSTSTDQLRAALLSATISDPSVNLRKLIADSDKVDSSDPSSIFTSIIPLFNAYLSEAIIGGNLITREAYLAAIEAILGALGDNLDDESSLFFVRNQGIGFMANHHPVTPNIDLGVALAFHGATVPS